MVGVARGRSVGVDEAASRNDVGIWTAISGVEVKGTAVGVANGKSFTTATGTVTS
jgi:hypothetical protein